MMYEKKCPICGLLQQYGSSTAFKRAIKRNAKCRICLYKDKSYIEKLSNSNVGQKRSDTSKHNMHIAFDRNRGTGVYANKGKDNPMFGRKGNKHPCWNRLHTVKEVLKMRKPRSEDFKRKMRIATQKRIDKMGGGANYNQIACLFFNHLNTILGYDGVHAGNKGEFKIKELGYSVDYYEPNLNLIIEWDEEHHYLNSELKLKDIKRQKEIIEFLNCQFIRIRQKDGSLIYVS